MGLTSRPSFSKQLTQEKIGLKLLTQESPLVQLEVVGVNPYVVVAICLQKVVPSAPLLSVLLLQFERAVNEVIAFDESRRQAAFAIDDLAHLSQSLLERVAKVSTI
jgi:hypothetical protein